MLRPPVGLGPDSNRHYGVTSALYINCCVCLILDTLRVLPVELPRHVVGEAGVAPANG